jgi:hypothetical protein
MTFFVSSKPEDRKVSGLRRFCTHFSAGHSVSGIGKVLLAEQRVCLELAALRNVIQTAPRGQEDIGDGILARRIACRPARATGVPWYT